MSQINLFLVNKTIKLTELINRTDSSQVRAISSSQTEAVHIDLHSLSKNQTGVSSDH